MSYKIFRLIAATIIGLSLSACSTVQTTGDSRSESISSELQSALKSDASLNSGEAELIVSRIFAMPTKLKSRISVDGKEVGRLGNGEYLRVPISEGTRNIKLYYNKLSLQKGDKIELNVEPGKVYAFNIDSGFAGHSNTDYGNNIRVDVRLLQTSSDSAMTCCRLVSK
jgi:hypothetical protein